MPKLELELALAPMRVGLELVPVPVQEVTAGLLEV